eukprot:4997846-Prymnesium_polylepis.1
MPPLEVMAERAGSSLETERADSSLRKNRHLVRAEAADEGRLDAEVDLGEGEEAVAVGVPAAVELLACRHHVRVRVVLVVERREEERQVGRVVLELGRLDGLEASRGRLVPPRRRRRRRHRRPLPPGRGWRLQL